MMSVVASTGRVSRSLKSSVLVAPEFLICKSMCTLYLLFTRKHSRDLYSQINLFLLRIVHISELDFILNQGFGEGIGVYALISAATAWLRDESCQIRFGSTPEVI